MINKLHCYKGRLKKKMTIKVNLLSKTNDTILNEMMKKIKKFNLSLIAIITDSYFVFYSYNVGIDFYIWYPFL